MFVHTYIYIDEELLSLRLEAFIVLEACNLELKLTCICHPGG